MFPLKDHNPTHRTALVTLLLIVANVGVYFLVQGAQTGRETIRIDSGEELSVPADLAFTLEWAAVPCEIRQGRPLTLDEVDATFARGDAEACVADSGSPEVFPDKFVWGAAAFSMFLHGGLLHLGGNMLYLWIFGNNIEDRLGHLKYLLFYLAGGLVATVAHIAVNVDSTVPVVGASGAIAAVMGAYLVWFPNAGIRTAVVVFFIFFTDIRAKWLLAFWFAMQFFTSDNSGVAWVAHVGGFAFGVVFGLLLRPRHGPRARRGTRPALGDPSYSGW